MNTKPHISIILTILSILALSTMTAQAQNLVVSNTAYPAVSGTHYENNASNAALTISGSLGSFTGTNITLTATAASGNGRIGANLTTQGSLNLANSTINAVLYGIQLTGTSSAVLNNTNITTGTTASAHGVNLATSSTLDMTGGTIRTSGGNTAYAVNLSGTSVASLSHVTFITEGTSAHAVVLATSSTVTIIGSTLTTGTTGAQGLNVGGTSYINVQDTTINSYSSGVYLAGYSTGTLNNVTINTRGQNAHALFESNATILASDVTINTVGMTAIGLYATGSSAIMNVDGVKITTVGTWSYGVAAYLGANVTVKNLEFSSSGTRAMGLVSEGNGSVITVNGGTITTVGERGHGIYLGNSGKGEVYLKDVDIHATGANANDVIMPSGNNSAKILVIDGGSITSAQGSVFAVNDNEGSTTGNAAGFQQTNNIADITVKGAAEIKGPAILNMTSIRTGTDSSGNLVDVDVPTMTALHIEDASTASGDIMNAGSAMASVDLDGDSSLAGNIATSGSSSTTINIDNSTLNSATIAANGNSTVAINAGNGTAKLGDITGSGSSTIAINLNGINSSITGDTTANDTSSIAITGSNGVAITGNIIGSGSSSTNIALTNSTLAGKTTVNDTATLNLSLFDSGTWYMVDNSTLTNLTAAKTARINFPAPTAAGTYHTLTVRNNLGGEGGTFAMHTDIAAGKADLLTIGGTASTGAHRIALTNANDNAITGAESPLLLVETAGGSATFTGTTTAGVYDYSVQNGAQVGNAFALPETNWYLYRVGISNIGNAIINTSAMLGYDWFYSLDALYLRMGDVRQENLTENGKLNTENSSGNLWLRGRGYRLNADASLSGRPFDEYAYALTAGADKAFHHNSNNTNASTTLLGAFLDIGRIDRDFSGDNAANISTTNNTGYTTSLSAGLYATHLTQTGWHADLVLKADRYKHHFDTTTADQLPVTGDYSNNALGASLEIGRRLQRADSYWVEPMVQAAYTWLGSATYRTAPASQALNVTIDSTRAAQYRALVRFGRRLANSRWLPYGKFGVVKTDLTGGALHIADGAGTLFVPDCDGWRVEFGAGTSYYINARSQLYFDYEYDRAPHYERPWALNLGYRYGW